MATAFTKIALLGRYGVRHIPQTLATVRDHLLAKGLNVIIERNTADLFPQIDSSVIVDADHLAEFSDLILVIGGDGSLINAAHIALKQKLPVLGINRGRLGFLTDIYPDNLDLLDRTLSGDYQSEQRFLISSCLMQGKQLISERLALNDIVILPGDIAHMIEYDILIDQQSVCSLRADGLIATTPTGSTAYALSGGGPILHPHIDAIGLVPMFPHTLSNRPIVVSANSIIEVRIPDSNKVTPFVSCDGQQRKALTLGQVLKISKHKNLLTLIHPYNYNYYDTLRHKLGWQN